jgi:hypothetical protein
LKYAISCRVERTTDQQHPSWMSENSIRSASKK